ncbi:MAG: hypothetical protein WC855_01295 [Thermodesulfovibrionales bacterium]
MADRNNFFCCHSRKRSASGILLEGNQKDSRPTESPRMTGHSSFAVMLRRTEAGMTKIEDRIVNVREFLWTIERKR